MKSYRVDMGNMLENNDHALHTDQSEGTNVDGAVDLQNALSDIQGK